MSNIRILGFPNHTAQAYVAPSTTGMVGLEPAEMEVEYVQTDEPSDRARLTTVDPFHSMFGFNTSNVPVTIDGIAAVNHNIADGGQIRFTAWTTNPQELNLPVKALPQTVVSSTNMTGTIGNVDEDISAPDGNSMGPTDPALSWSVTIRFFALSGTVNPAADMLCLVARVKRVITSGTPTTLPVLDVSLQAPVLSLGSRAITATGSAGQIVIFPFRRSDFTSVSDLQVKLAFNVFSGGQHATLESVAVYYEDTSAVGTPDYDSEWLTVDTDSRLERVRPSQQTHFFPTAPWTGVIAYCCQFRSDQAIHNPLRTIGNLVATGAVPDQPLTFVEAGVVPAGLAISPEIGIRKGAGMPGPESVGVDGATATGQTYGANAYSLRVSDPLELIVTRDELLLLQDQLGFRRGRARSFYVALEPGVAMKYQAFTSFWATLKRMSHPRPLGRYKADGTMRFLVEVEFEEKL